jgi:UDP-N-acetylmuramyl tripeptide synthase
MNALQAGALAVALGASAAEVERGLAGVEAPPGRLQPVVVRGVGAAGGGVMAGPTVYVDYAHTDDALERALAACRELLSAGGAGGEAGTRGRLVCVFGCGGDRDRSKRPKMGAAAARGADVVVITSDNPRTERPGAIIEEIVEGVKAVRGVSDGVRVEEDRQRAIEWAIESAGAGDIVLIAGKGHETYQIMPDGRGGTVKRDFDDRLVAAGALRAWHARVGGVGGVKR